MNSLNSYLVIFLVLLLVIVVYSLFKRVIEEISHEKTLKKLTNIMMSETNLRLLDVKLIKALTNDLGISKAYFVLVSDIINRPVTSLDIASSPNIVRNEQVEKLLHHVKTRTIFRNLLVVPLLVADEDIGLLVLEPKISRRKYTGSELEMLDVFAPQAGLAFKNASIHEKLEQLSRMLEMKVIERTKQLEQSQAERLKLKDEFVFIATHDLATPVTAISGFSALIKNSNEELPPHIKAYLSAITEASNRLKVLVNDLLQVARSDSGSIKVELTTLDAAPIIQAAVREITPLANERKIEIIVNLEGDNHLQADQVKLSEICENLLSNGVKYNREGGSLSISSRVQEDKYILEFKDTGIGIPSAEQSKVFSKFFRSELPEVRQRPGTGLGLFVVQMLTEKLGGKISFKSVEGQGTTFELSFSR